MKVTKNRESKNKRTQSIASDSKRQWLGVRRSLWMVLGVVGVLAMAFVAMQVSRRNNIAKLREECVASREAKNWTLLEAKAVRWSALDPLNFEPFLMAAAAAEQQGDLARMAGYMQVMPATAPTEIWLQLSQVQLETLNDPQASIDTCTKVRNKDPSNRAAHERLLYFWCMSRQMNKLEEECARAIKQGAATKLTYAYWFGRDRFQFSNAWETNQRWVEAYPDDESFHVAAVLSLLHAVESRESADVSVENMQEARRKRDADLDLLKSRFPTNVETFGVLFDRYTERGDIATVKKLLAEAGEPSKNDHRYWRTMGWVQSSEGDNKRALESYTKAVSMAPLDGQNYFERANVLRQLGELDSMKSDSQRAAIGNALIKMMRDASDLYSLKDEFFQQLIEYADLCAQKDFANGLRALLKSRP